VKAAVAWYGSLVRDKTELTPTNPVDVAAQIQGAVLGLYGGADTGIPVDTVEQMRKALGPNSRSQIHVYPDAPHAFFADYRPSYRKEAAEDGWRRAIAWFKEHGVA
jgi:carboxymethylenebutenolidase